VYNYRVDRSAAIPRNSHFDMVKTLYATLEGGLPEDPATWRRERGDVFMMEGRAQTDDKSGSLPVFGMTVCWRWVVGCVGAYLNVDQAMRQ